ncbi:hypothetical protein B0H14DRAFT_3164417 [Mycena olivaceomarginata]|nr:hypothetical protein B0H14DRAFT_3164417 [Mycena olivaceomarginata]
MLNKIIATSIFVLVLAAATISAQTIKCECPPFECSSPETCCNTEPPTPLVSAVCKLCFGNAELLHCELVECEECLHATQINIRVLEGFCGKNTGDLHENSRTLILMSLSANHETETGKRTSESELDLNKK